jgi:hypothetical protein
MWRKYLVRTLITQCKISKDNLLLPAVSKNNSGRDGQSECEFAINIISIHRKLSIKNRG